MQNARDRSVLDEYTTFETNQLAVISGNEKAIAKTVGNGVINVIENGTPGVAGVKGVVHAGENAYQASQLHDSLWYGVGGALRVDELSERVTSERKTTLEAIWSFFSWIGESIVSGVRAIVPFFGSEVDATNMSKVVYDAATANFNVDFDREDLQEIIHVDDEDLMQKAAKLLDQNKDG